MPTLREVQAEIAQVILGNDVADIARHLRDDAAIPAPNRLNIHRNNYRGALIGSLRITYPAVDRLVGTAFFDGTAGAFIAAHPPREAYLNAYGAAFGDFLADFPLAATLPYLPDVARLEWAVNRAANAPDAPPLDPSALAGLDERDQGRVRFVPHPSTVMPRLAYDADAIRRAVMANDNDGLAALAPKPDPFWLLVHRRGIDVVMRRLDEGEARFTAGLLAGQPLGEVLSPGAGDTRIALLAEHLASGRFTRFELAEIDGPI